MNIKHTRARSHVKRTTEISEISTKQVVFFCCALALKQWGVFFGIRIAAFCKTAETGYLFE